MKDAFTRKDATWTGELGRSRRGLPSLSRMRGDRQPSPPEQLHEQIDGLFRRDREPATNVGQALADQALRRVDQQHGGLQSPPAIDQVGLLPGVLEVVARIRLVGSSVDEVGGAHREVRVDVDARTTTAVVPVVAAPRLVPNEPDSEVFAVRQAEQAASSGSKSFDQPFDDPRQPIDVELEAGIPGGNAIGESRRPGQEAVDFGRGSGKHGLVASPRRPAEATREELEVRRPSARRHECLGPKCRELR
jgi:hypothetical protein